MAESDRARWNQRYLDGAGLSEPSSFLQEVFGLLPSQGRALDLAGGAGRHALWLAGQGLDVTLCDVAEEGLRVAGAKAEAQGLAIERVQRDVETVGAPAGPWDLIVVFHYLWRGLFPALPGLLAPGGRFLYCHPTTRNLERNPRPSARFLLQEGELPGALPPELEVLRCEEAWHGDRHEVRLVAQRLAFE